MSGIHPFDQLIGSLDIWIAPYGTTVPDVDDAPPSPWARLGATDGGQAITHGGDLEKRSDDDHTGTTIAFRPEEELTITATLVGLTLENYAAVLNDAALIETGVGPPATKTMPMKKGFYPTEYAALLRGDVMSPYGVLPGMYVFPRVVFGGEPEVAHAKDERAGLEFEATVMEDDEQTDENMSLGWLVVQTA